MISAAWLTGSAESRTVAMWIAESNRAMAVSSNSVVVRGCPYVILPVESIWLTAVPEQNVSAKKI